MELLRAPIVKQDISVPEGQFEHEELLQIDPNLLVLSPTRATQVYASAGPSARSPPSEESSCC
jgi:hypothetical protein